MIVFESKSQFDEFCRVFTSRQYRFARRVLMATRVERLQSAASWLSVPFSIANFLLLFSTPVQSLPLLGCCLGLAVIVVGSAMYLRATCKWLKRESAELEADCAVIRDYLGVEVSQ